MANRSGEHFGNYRLVRLLGQGGFAEVYLGQHLRLAQQAAIKVLHAHLTDTEEEHFHQEAQTISTLVHPRIIRVFDYDVQDGVPFLVMDYAPGGSLRKLYPRGSVVPLSQIVSYVKQVADALQYAHEQKFIHRDVKPENILLGRRDEVLLSDFGIATIAHSSGSLSTKEAVGTLSYMAPEQIEGHPRAASDQYALGCVVYEWLCGARPFEGSPTEVMVQQLSMSPVPLHEKVATIPLGIEQVVLRALAKDPKQRYDSVAAFAVALEEASLSAYSPTAFIPGERLVSGIPAAAAFASVAAQGASSPSPETPAEPDTPPYLADNATLAATTPAASFLATTPAPAEVPALPRPVSPPRKTLARLPAALLIGLAFLVVAGAVLGSLSLLAHVGVLGARLGPPAIQVARGGTWNMAGNTGSLIPNGPAENTEMMDALYLPLFSGDAQGVIHAAAATEVPSIKDGGVSTDATTWTFHLRPGLVWSDGQPYDARDVDFTWRLWKSPQFAATATLGLNLISSADVSADHLSITFHLTRPFAPFLADLWVDGWFAPLPAHHFSSMAPAAILKSPDNLNPHVTSGPFLMAESVPGGHYTLVRNPRYYLARQGLPYLDKLVFTVYDHFPLEKMQAGSLDTSGLLQDVPDFQTLQGLKDYTLIYPPTQNDFEALYFNFHNTLLATHPEVRQAMAMAVDQQTLIAQALKGLGTELCTDHPSAYHPGFEPEPPCPVFGLAAANQVLDDAGWVKGKDGVRTRDGQRLEFEYSTNVTAHPERATVQSIIQRDFGQVGIKLDIQNYPYEAFFNSLLPQGKASPPTGAVAGRYDIAEFATTQTYDPDDSGLFACDQFPSAANNFTAQNFAFYCNPALDKLFAQEQATADPGVRQQLFQQIHRIYLAQFPFIVLYSPTFYALVHKGTHNFLPGPFGDTYNIAQWWCDRGKC